MKVIGTSIPGLVVVETNLLSDTRGSFSRFFCKNELENILGTRHVVQINHSCTKAVGAVRGMHYQSSPHAEMKIVRCIRGRVWDVAVDLRADSPTFLQWHAQELTPSNRLMMVIPEGMAHGFQVLDADSELLYLHTEYYSADDEGGVQPTDPRIAIAWPLPIQDLSHRDQNHLLLPTNFSGLHV